MTDWGRLAIRVDQAHEALGHQAGDGAGQVEDVFVEPRYRHRGLGAALIHCCVADCRRRGSNVVVIVADAGDTPQAMYAAMGFRHVATKRRYVLYPKSHC